MTQKMQELDSISDFIFHLQNDDEDILTNLKNKVSMLFTELTVLPLCLGNKDYANRAMAVSVAFAFRQV
jgi:hypothetical protein